jgi:hypothetical protein
LSSSFFSSCAVSDVSRRMCLSSAAWDISSFEVCGFPGSPKFGVSQQPGTLNGREFHPTERTGWKLTWRRADVRGARLELAVALEARQDSGPEVVSCHSGHQIRDRVLERRGRAELCHGENEMRIESAVVQWMLKLGGLVAPARLLFCRFVSARVGKKLM